MRITTERPTDFSHRTRVLFLTCHLPWPPVSGGRLREWELLRRLSHDVDISLLVVSKTYEEDIRNIEVLREHCSRVEVFPAQPVPDDVDPSTPFQVVRHRSPALTDRVRQLLLDGRIDLLHVEAFYMMQHVARESRVPVLLVEQNVEYSLWRQRTMQAGDAPVRAANLYEYLKTLRAETSCWERADLCAALTTEDRDMMLAACPGIEVRLVPDGADHLSRVSPEAPVAMTPSMVYVANFAYEPNVDAARYLCSEILPLVRKKVPDATVFLVGNGDVARRLGCECPEGVVITGRVGDVAPYVEGASVVVCPLRVGGGVKVKVIEALRMGKALVTTSVGVQGLPNLNGECVVADAAKPFADAVVKLLTRPGQRRRLEISAARYAASLPTWDDAASALLQCYRGLAPTSRVPTLDNATPLAESPS